MSEKILCSYCGTSFDPDMYTACRTCPLQKNCNLACCPTCGYEAIIPERSVLGRLARRLLSKTLSKIIHPNLQREIVHEHLQSSKTALPAAPAAQPQDELQ